MKRIVRYAVVKVVVEYDETAFPLEGDIEDVEELLGVIGQEANYSIAFDQPELMAKIVDTDFLGFTKECSA